MRHTMTLVADRAAGVWTVVCSDPEVRRLFGTCILPTPYSLTRPEAEMLAGLRRLNPDREIRSAS